MACLLFLFMTYTRRHCQTDTEEDTILIWTLWESKGYGAWRLFWEFSDKNWKRRGIKKLSRNVHETGLLDLTWSCRPRTSRSCVVQSGAVTDWWYSWPMASTLASLCLSQRRTFWTYVVTINLFFFSVLDELYVPPHAWCSRCCSMSAL